MQQFTAYCEAMGNQISTSKSEVMVLGHRGVGCPLRVGDGLLTQVEAFKYFLDLFTSEGKGERKAATPLHLKESAEVVREFDEDASPPG